MGNEKQCTKVRYKTKKEARTKLNYLRKDRSVKIKPVREYECPDCFGYHLTHQRLD